MYRVCQSMTKKATVLRSKEKKNNLMCNFTHLVK